jgi:hypothetical protein
MINSHAPLIPRRHVADIWGIAEEEMPRAGVDCYEFFRKVESGDAR